MAHHSRAPAPPPRPPSTQVVDVIEGAFALAAVRDESAFAQTALARASVCYSVDRELVREKKGEGGGGGERARWRRWGTAG